MSTVRQLGNPNLSSLAAVCALNFTYEVTSGKNASGRETASAESPGIREPLLAEMQQGGGPRGTWVRCKEMSSEVTSSQLGQGRDGDASPFMLSTVGSKWNVLNRKVIRF